MDETISAYFFININEVSHFRDNSSQLWTKLFQQGRRFDYLYFSLSRFLVVYMDDRLAFQDGNLQFASDTPYSLVTMTVPKLIWEKLVGMRQIVERKWLQKAHITYDGCIALSSEPVSLTLEKVTEAPGRYKDARRLLQRDGQRYWLSDDGQWLQAPTSSTPLERSNHRDNAC